MVLDCIIVDDEETSRVAMAALVNKSSRLKLLGTAENGEEALKVTQKSNPDIIFLDVTMPNMDGFEFLDHLENRHNLRVILVTADKEYALKAFDYNITDYLLKPVSWHRFNQAVDRVVSSVKGEAKGGMPSNFLLLKLIRFMYSRNIDVLEPMPSRDSLIGYSYALLHENLDFSQHAHALNILENAEEDGIFSSSFVDVVYLCSNCSNSYLGIRESCPKCQSTNLKSQELIHHFSCAYMGPESEFKESKMAEELTCPKCSRRLKHIGVDYDKPSSIFKCRNCDNSFQDPMLKAKCNNCGADSQVEHLERRVIKKYTLTAKGKDMAEGNLYIQSQNKQEESISGLEQNKYYFQRVVKSEIDRKAKADFASTLGMLTLMNIEDLYEQIGQNGKKKLLAELFDVLTGTLSASDELTFRDNETLLILFPERKASVAEKSIQELKSRIKQLISDNFDGFGLEITHAVYPIQEGMDYSAHVAELSAKLNQAK